MARTKWFEVENYVKYLTDHVRSVVKGQCRKVTIEEFSTKNGTFRKPIFEIAEFVPRPVEWPIPEIVPVAVGPAAPQVAKAPGVGSYAARCGRAFGRATNTAVRPLASRGETKARATTSSAPTGGRPRSAASPPSVQQGHY